MILLLLYVSIINIELRLLPKFLFNLRAKLEKGDSYNHSKPDQQIYYVVVGTYKYQFLVFIFGGGKGSALSFKRIHFFAIYFSPSSLHIFWPSILLTMLPTQLHGESSTFIVAAVGTAYIFLLSFFLAFQKFIMMTVLTNILKSTYFSPAPFPCPHLCGMSTVNKGEQYL